MSPEDNSDPSLDSQSHSVEPSQPLPSTGPAPSLGGPPAQPNTSVVTEQPSQPPASNVTTVVDSILAPQQQPSSQTTQPVSADSVIHNPTTNNPKSRKRIKKIMLALAIVVLFVLGIGGAFLLGKHHERVVIESPPPQPINLPPQATVLNSCEPGRGKQYIIPKDIPDGPIYDVENSKVIAIEYNIEVSQLFVNSNAFSNAILNLTKNYAVNHFSLIMGQTVPGQILPESIHLIMFVVSAAEANSITCKSASTT